MTKFTFQGIKGSVDKFGFVCWGGMGFQIEAAGPELKAVIAAAIKKAA
jgi:hypothetical protein